MAKIQFGPALGNNGAVTDFYDAPLQLQAGRSDSEKVIFKDTGAGNDKITLIGSGFEWQDGADIIGFGEVNAISFATKTGSASYMTVRGLSLDVGAFNEAYLNEGVQGVIDLLTDGNDTVLGSKNSDSIKSGDGRDVVRGGAGNDTIDGGAKNDQLHGDAGRDYILGGAGNDRLWGGAGSDWFHFSEGSRKDVIVDFDARGGGRKQDYLSLHAGDDFTVKSSGKNLILDFGDGDTLTLLDVRRADFSRADIDWIV
jgi:Ca2+-binding RTX toxin-like protein